jgi:O-antigen ligase
MSRSRSPAIIFIIVIGIFAFFHYRLTDFKGPKKILGFMLIIFFLFFSFFWVNADQAKIKRKYMSLINIPKYAISYLLHGDQTLYKTINRLPLWHNAVGKFKKNPIFGIGLGNEYTNYLIKEKSKRRLSHPHNTLLQVMVETGLIGLSVYMILLSLIINRMGNLYRSIPSKNEKLCYLFFPLSFLFFLFFSFFHFAIHENYFLWYFAGIITGFDTSG